MRHDITFMTALPAGTAMGHLHNQFHLACAPFCSKLSDSKACITDLFVFNSATYYGIKAFSGLDSSGIFLVWSNATKTKTCLSFFESCGSAESMHYIEVTRSLMEKSALSLSLRPTDEMASSSELASLSMILF